jgi:uncharacterized paraquat-inducible protein A
MELMYCTCEIKRTKLAGSDSGIHDPHESWHDVRKVQTSHDYAACRHCEFHIKLPQMERFSLRSMCEMRCMEYGLQQAGSNTRSRDAAKAGLADMPSSLTE